MGLLSSILGLPTAPVRLVVSLARVIQQRVDQETSSPTAARHELEAATAARAAGEISAEREREIEQAALSRLITPASGPAAEDAR